MKYNHILSNFIADRIDKEINHSIIITGLHRSGKTTMMKELIGDYPYIKWTYNYNTFDMGVQSWKQLYQYNIFDRSPLIDKYVHAYPYNSNGTIDEKTLLEHQILFFENHIKYLIKPLFIIYLHSVWDDGTKPEYTKDKNTHSTEVLRYLNMIDYLNKNKYQVIVCTEKYIKSYNINLY